MDWFRHGLGIIVSAYPVGSYGEPSPAGVLARVREKGKQGEMHANDERAYEIQYQETAPGVWEGVLTDHQTGQQYASGSLRELVAILGRLLDRATEDGNEPEPVGEAA